MSSPVQNTVSALEALAVIGVVVSAGPVFADQTQQPVVAVASVQLLLLPSATEAAEDVVSDAASVTAAVLAAAVGSLEFVEL